MAMQHNISRQEYLAKIKPAYALARKRKDKKTKTALLDNAVSIIGLHRKYLVAWNMHTSGLNITNITQVLQRDRSTIYRWLKAIIQGNTEFYKVIYCRVDSNRVIVRAGQL